MAKSFKREFTCPVELAVEVLGGKWKTVILAHLKERERRYGELRALMPALSDKMLTERLQDLLELGLITRRKQGGRGAPASYALSPLGQRLGPTLTALYAWGEEIAPRIGATVAR